MLYNWKRRFMRLGWYSDTKAAATDGSYDNLSFPVAYSSSSVVRRAFFAFVYLDTHATKKAF